jgi:hypothetical protein
MKSIYGSALFFAALLATNAIQAQITNLDLGAIEAAGPSSPDELPLIGNYYSAANPDFGPAPANFFGLWGWPLGGENYLLDDLPGAPSGGTFGGSFAMDDSEPPYPDGTNSVGESFDNFSLNTNGLWLWITNAANDTVYANIYNATDYVYEIYSATNLATSAQAVSNWDVENIVFPVTNTTVTPFSVPMNGRNPLFLWARDWTGITNNGNVTPSWWFYEWFGTINLSDDDYDSQNNTLYYDYLNGIDPDIINFGLIYTNQYFNFSDPPVQLDIVGGTPYYIAVLVDDPNEGDATWANYTSSNIIINLGSTEGWHNIYVGLRGKPPDADQTWVATRLKLELSPPLLTITNPIGSTTTQAIIQLQGYSDEALASISYDLSNANGLVTNQQALILDEYYDTNMLELTTNNFQCFDVPLISGSNIITLHAADLAGNVTTTNFTFALDYSSDTNPPVIQLNWPQNGTQISGTNFTWRGHISEPTAQVAVQIVSTNGITNSVNGQVGRDGDFWVYGLPLSTGTNYLSLTASDAAGNISTTNIIVTQSSVIVKITSAAFGQSVQGTISDWTNYTVWVNGVIATNNGDGTWVAYPTLTLDTSVVQARAIPNSDNGGYGGGQ